MSNPQNNDKQKQKQKEEEEEEIITKWTDDRIRFSDCEDDDNNDDDDDDDRSSDDEEAMIDPFKDPNPFQTFSFEYQIPKQQNRTIQIEIHGYKPESDEVWKSTGVTLWKASEHLNLYMVQHSDWFDGTAETTTTHDNDNEDNNKDSTTIIGEKPNKNIRVLEIGAGLGLNGIMAHRLGASCVYVTDGDVNALKYLRQNIEQNKRPLQIIAANNPNDTTTDTDTTNTASATIPLEVYSRQLLWGRDTSLAFLKQYCCSVENNDNNDDNNNDKTVSNNDNDNNNNEKNQKLILFDIILASDIIYAEVIIPPLWETIQTLLQKPNGVFIMAFAQRRLKVSIEHVLETSNDAGFFYERVDKQDIEDIYIYTFRWKKEEEEKE